MPQWVYAAAASVAMLALAVMVTADAAGLLAPSGGSGPIASRQFAADQEAKRGPDVRQDAESESAPAPPGGESRAVAPAAATPLAAAAPVTAAKPTPELETDATPSVAASRSPQPEPTSVEPGAKTRETAGPGPGVTPPPTPAAGPGGPAVAPTQPVPGYWEVVTPHVPPATETPQMAVEPTPVAQSEPKHPSEDGSERRKLAGQRRGTWIGWRVLEGVAAALGLSFLIGLVLRRRVSRRITGV